jgi:predicted RNase H-like HicB family nuclease
MSEIPEARPANPANPIYHYIVSESPEGGYTGQCLEIAGAISEGDTLEELARNMHDAIQLVIEYTHERATAGNEMIRTIEVEAIREH